MTDMQDMSGWDEFSAYAWLNSVNGKKSIQWPLTEQVPMHVVRQYISNSKNQNRIYPKQMDADCAVLHQDHQGNTVPCPDKQPYEAAAIQPKDEYSPIAAALDELTAVLKKKNADYSNGGDFWNFEFAADMVGGGMSTDAVMRTQIAIKLGRIQTLLETDAGVENEPLLDSFRDLAGYAIILYAYWKDTLDE